jgi:hypothetical protein
MKCFLKSIVTLVAIFCMMGMAYQAEACCSGGTPPPQPPTPTTDGGSFGVQYLAGNNLNGSCTNWSYIVDSYFPPLDLAIKNPPGHAIRITVTANDGSYNKTTCYNWYLNTNKVTSNVIQNIEVPLNKHYSITYTQISQCTNCSFSTNGYVHFVWSKTFYYVPNFYPWAGDTKIIDNGGTVTGCQPGSLIYCN